MRNRSRRQVLRVTGAALAATVAGCGGDGDEGDSGDTDTQGGNGSGTDTQRSSDGGTDTQGDNDGDTDTQGGNDGGTGALTADAVYEAPVDNPTGIMHKSEYDSEVDEEVENLVVADGERQEEYLVELDGISATVKQQYTLDTPGDELSVSGLTYGGVTWLGNAATNSMVELSLGGVNIEPPTVEFSATPKGLYRKDNSATLYVVLGRSDGNVVAELNADNSGIRRETPIPGGTGYGVFGQRDAGFRFWANNRNSQFVRVGFSDDTPSDSFDIEFGPVKDVTVPGVEANTAWAVTDDGQIAEFTPPASE